MVHADCVYANYWLAVCCLKSLKAAFSWRGCSSPAGSHSITADKQRAKNNSVVLWPTRSLSLQRQAAAGRALHCTALHRVGHWLPADAARLAHWRSRCLTENTVYCCWLLNRLLVELQLMCVKSTADVQCGCKLGNGKLGVCELAVSKVLHSVHLARGQKKSIQLLPVIRIWAFQSLVHSSTRQTAPVLSIPNPVSCDSATLPHREILLMLLILVVLLELVSLRDQQDQPQVRPALL